MSRTEGAMAIGSIQEQRVTSWQTSERSGLHQTRSGARATSVIPETEVRRKNYELVIFYPPAMTFEPVHPDMIFGLQRKPSGQKKEPVPLGVYIHIPFCTGRCGYCHYVTCIRPSKTLISRYLSSLAKELSLLTVLGVFENRPLSFIHVGGGTPTFLPNNRVGELMQRLAEVCRMENDAEVTWEASAETAAKRKLACLRENGVTRLSIGVQSFDDELLKMCKRRHDAKRAQEAIRDARTCGFNSLNIDLIFGLPTQDIAKWSASLKTACDLGVGSITVYRLRLRPETEFAEWHRHLFPAQSECVEMHRLAIDIMKSAGYRHVQPNQFVLPGVADHRYVRQKWGDQAEFLGLGVSSYSFYNGWTFANARSLRSYFESLAQDRLPVCLGRLMTSDQEMRKFLILGLKLLDIGVSKAIFQAKFGKALSAVFGDILVQLYELGFLIEDGETVRLSELGALFADDICVAFYSPEEKALLMGKGATKYGSYLSGSINTGFGEARTRTCGRSGLSGVLGRWL